MKSTRLLRTATRKGLGAAFRAASRVTFGAAFIAAFVATFGFGACSKPKPVGSAPVGVDQPGQGEGRGGKAVSCDAFCRRVVTCGPDKLGGESLKKAMDDCRMACHKTPPPPNPDGLFVAALKDCVASTSGCDQFRDCAREKLAVLQDQVKGQTEDPNAIYAMPLDGDPMVGNGLAPVTMVGFLDPQCHFCRQSISVLDAVLAKHKGQVRFVLRAFPLADDPVSTMASQAAIEVYGEKGPDAFWRFEKKVFAADHLTRAVVETLARGVGADPGRLRKALDAQTHKGAVARSVAVGHRFGVAGTPSFFINGKKYPGFLDEAELDQAIDEAGRRAKTLLGQGVTPQKLYAALTAKGYRKVHYIKTAPRGELDPEGVYRVIAGPGLPQKGPDDALVTIVEFTDFQCPFCRRLTETLEELLKLYPKDVRLVFRNLPLPMHPYAFMAAEAAQIVFHQKGNAAFWTFHDMLFHHQQELSLAKLEQFAVAVGVDVAKYRKALADHQYEGWVNKDAAFAEGLGVIAAPQMFINGKPMSGAYPLAQVKKRVGAELAAARTLVKAGVARSMVYEHIIEHGRSRSNGATTQPVPNRDGRMKSLQGATTKSGRVDGATTESGRVDSTTTKSVPSGGATTRSRSSGAAHP